MKEPTRRSFATKEAWDQYRSVWRSSLSLTRKSVQAKSIDDDMILEAIDRSGGLLMRSELKKHIAAFPTKVVNAKLKSMLKRGIITGCRGDFKKAT